MPSDDKSKRKQNRKVENNEKRWVEQNNERKKKEYRKKRRSRVSELDCRGGFLKSKRPVETQGSKMCGFIMENQ